MNETEVSTKRNPSQNNRCTFAAFFLSAAIFCFFSAAARCSQSTVSVTLALLSVTSERKPTYLLRKLLCLLGLDAELLGGLLLLELFLELSNSLATKSGGALLSED